MTTRNALLVPLGLALACAAGFSLGEAETRVQALEERVAALEADRLPHAYDATGKDLGRIANVQANTAESGEGIVWSGHLVDGFSRPVVVSSGELLDSYPFYFEDAECSGLPHARHRRAHLLRGKWLLVPPGTAPLPSSTPLYELSTDGCSGSATSGIGDVFPLGQVSPPAWYPYEAPITVR